MTQQQPILDEEDTYTDWHRARYEPDIHIINDEKASIFHTVRNSVALKEAVNAGHLKAVTEILCPKTLHNKLFISQTDDIKNVGEDVARIEQNIALPIEDMMEEAFIITDLVCIEDFQIPTQELNEFIWGKEETQTIKQGWSMVRSTPRRVKSITQSLMKMKVDNTLDNGEIRVETRNDEQCFVVHIATNIRNEAHRNKDLARAALVGVCAEFPNASFLSLDSGTRISKTIRGTLEGKIADKKHKFRIDWEQEEEYDPAYVATLLEPFKPLQLEETE